MKVFSTYLVLLTALAGATSERGNAFQPASSDVVRVSDAHTTYNDWIDAADFTPMPQCIAQQDQTAWLSTMTQCTSKRCTRHFGVICTAHHWYTDLSCLSSAFSPDVVKGYLPLCSRSVLAEAQLYQWIREVTGRTWLVEAGDANGLQTLSPASLADGYAAIDVIDHAPRCLTGSHTAQAMESFQHVMAFCSFTGTTQHTGNAARPWEYNERLQSIIALDSETAGYTLTQHSIGRGNYFDKQCFCSVFTVNAQSEPCATKQIELTRERLWMNATCGSTSVPDNWTDAIQTTEFDYIPSEDWHWPKCVNDMPKQLIRRADQCTTDACTLESSGYCKAVVRAVDRVCYCRAISYNSCGGSCQIFEMRTDYVRWLHDLCGDVQDWHGLPEDWTKLAAPTLGDMIPWRWSLKPSNDSSLPSTPHMGPTTDMDSCPSTEWKLTSLFLINIATLFAPAISRRTDTHRIARRLLQRLDLHDWVSTGILIAALQLFAHWFNASLVVNTSGYEHISIIQLMLLWCSMPRLNWLTTLLTGIRTSGATSSSTAAASLLAETILQTISFYVIIVTVDYGREHGFYLRGMHRLGSVVPAQLMYAGALLWLIVIVVMLVLLLQATCTANRLAGPDANDALSWRKSKRDNPNAVKYLIALLNERWVRLEEGLTHRWVGRTEILETPIRHEGLYTVYGTIPVRDQSHQAPRIPFMRVYAVAIMSMGLLWVAQWVFWAGFIGLSVSEFCPPKLGIVTAIWMAFSMAGTIAASSLSDLQNEK